jgi:hypothetical protein
MAMSSSRSAAAIRGRRVGALARARRHATRAMASLFGHVEPAPKDPILGVTEAFLADPSPDKVNVGVVRLSLSLSLSLSFGSPISLDSDGDVGRGC